MPKDTFFNLPEEKRQLIIDLAIEEFAAHDYKSASISRIVAQAQIAKGSFYQYFENKQELYLFLLDLASQEKAAFLQTMSPPNPEMGTFAYLRWLFEAGIKFGFSNPRLTNLAYRAAFGNTPLPAETVRNAKMMSAQFFEGMVIRGIEQGDLAPDLDVESTVFLFNLLFAELGAHIMSRLDIDPDEMKTQGITLFETTDAAQIFESFMHMLEHGMGHKSV